MSLTLVTGKGGVGKTRCALLYYQSLTSRSKLLIGNLPELQREAKILQISAPSLQEEPSSEELMMELLLRVLKLQTIADWLSKKKLLQNLLRLAPNLEELLTLHSWVQKAKTHDLVVDAASTGSFLGILKSIPTALKMFESGAIREIANEVDQFFKAAKDVKVMLVSIPENSALEEMKELEVEIKKIYPQVPLIKTLNRIHLAPPTELNMSEDLRSFCNARRAGEEMRSAHLHFDYRLQEGAPAWA